jgi:hypothetical protein
VNMCKPVCTYMYIYVYMYICVYIYMHTHTRTCIEEHIHDALLARLWSLVNVLICVSLYAYMYVYIYIYICIYIHVVAFIAEGIRETLTERLKMCMYVYVYMRLHHIHAWPERSGHLSCEPKHSCIQTCSTCIQTTLRFTNTTHIPWQR